MKKGKTQFVNKPLHTLVQEHFHVTIKSSNHRKKKKGKECLMYVYPYILRIKHYVVNLMVWFLQIKEVKASDR